MGLCHWGRCCKKSSIFCQQPRAILSQQSISSALGRAPRLRAHMVLNTQQATTSLTGAECSAGYKLFSRKQAASPTTSSHLLQSPAHQLYTSAPPVSSTHKLYFPRRRAHSFQLIREFFYIAATGYYPPLLLVIRLFARLVSLKSL